LKNTDLLSTISALSNKNGELSIFKFELSEKYEELKMNSDELISKN
jgi:hypothetical protein